MKTKVNYPSHLVDPLKKDKKWIMQYIKAAWTDYGGTNFGSFFNHRSKYQTVRDYATGNQSINKYKPLLDIDDSSNESYLNISWDVVPLFSKFRRLAISRLAKQMYEVSADPIDSLAKSETEEHFKTSAAKIKLRNELNKIDPSLVELTPLVKEEGEADTLDELELQKKYTYKHRMAIEMEQALSLILFMNKHPEQRKQSLEDLFDFGVAGFKEWIDPNGTVRLRRVSPYNVITNRVESASFQDLQHAGEVKEYSIADLKKLAGDQFTDKEYKDIAENVVGKYTNPITIPYYTSMGAGYDDFKVRVLELEFYSVNTMYHETGEDRIGNKHVTRSKKKKGKPTSYKVVYKGSWIVDTKYAYDCGLATDMKRAKSRLMDTTLSYHFKAINFNNMKITGITEQCIPIIDNFQLAWYKFQQAIAEARPKGIQIEMTSLENIPLGQGGEVMKPMEVIDLYTKKGILVYRAIDESGDFVGYKPIEELNNGIGDEAANWFNVIQSNIQMIREVTGLNELTDGSTPNSRTLTTVAQLANEGTNNSLWPIINADMDIFKELCSDLCLRIQDSVRKGEVSGYVQALGKDSVEFIKVSPNVSLHEYGIEITLAPTEAEKDQLIQEAKAYAGEGMISFEDVLLVKNSRNLKVAEQILAFRIEKRLKESQENSLALQEANAQTQQQSVLVAEEEKRKTAQFEADLELRKLEMEYGLKMKLELAIKEKEKEIAALREEGRVATSVINNDSKEFQTSVSS